MSLFEARTTPYAPDYQTCYECRVTLCIYPGEIHPDRITELLNISPTERYVAGEQRVNSRGKSFPIKISSWFFCSEDTVHSKDLREHIDWIIDKISNSSAALHQLQETPGIKMTLKCVWLSAVGHGGPTLWPEQMKALADLGLECTFDIYFFPDE